MLSASYYRSSPGDHELRRDEDDIPAAGGGPGKRGRRYKVRLPILVVTIRRAKLRKAANLKWEEMKRL
jgi:hypothetical protein